MRSRSIKTFDLKGRTLRATRPSLACAVTLLAMAGAALAQGTTGNIVHDAEYYVLYEQNGERWAAEDQDLDRKLTQLREKFGQPPNIIHIMWDDMAYGDVGIPEINKIRGFDTPSLNRMADEGMAFVRMYTEPSCTPSRAAVITGRHPVRHGMVAVGWPFEFGGLAGEEVTTAEVLSAAGYATGFFSKWHLGDIEESYPYNQGFDEALFTPYNQLGGIWNAQGAAANAALGIAPELLVDDPYELDRVGIQPQGWVMTIDGKKGEAGREWGNLDNETYEKIDRESEERILEFMRANAEAKKPFYVAYWPNYLEVFPKPQKTTLHGGGIAEGMVRLDAYIGRVMDELEALGIAENTLLVAMADNGPMVSKTPAGWGMSEMIFRGGKGQYWEGGVRVPAFAWWPGVIEPSQIVGDIIHETDLYTTFARLAGASLIYSPGLV